MLAALACLAAVYPITELFVSAAWLSQAMIVIALVAVIGLVARGLTTSRALVVVSQLVLIGYLVIARFAEGTMHWGLPTRETWGVLAAHGAQALDTIQRYTAPAPLNTGITFCLIVAIALVAISVDAMAATWGSPAAAGLPLLTAYLITAANGNQALQLRYFVVPVALWLLMLHTTARAQFSRWSTTSSTDADNSPAIGSGDERVGGPDPVTDGGPAGDDRRARWSLTSSAVRVGVAGVVIAALLPVAIPHFAPRYLTDGLGQRMADSGRGSVGFNDTIDVTRSLNDTDGSPVLRYTTTGTGRAPLRVLATSYYSGGQWRVVGRNDNGINEPVPLPPANVRKDYVMNVTDNTLQPPRIAAPYPVVAVAMNGVRWGINPVTRDVEVAERPSSYRVTYADVTPSPPALRKAADGLYGPDVVTDDLALPDTSRALLERWSKEVTAGEGSNLDKAIAIQNHLRDTSRYAYSLDLGETPRDARGLPLEPMQAFYQTRRGYCVQFASAMIFLARAQGIPARMAIGFLPGTAEGSSRLVRAADAHAWPELYFAGFGWLRFEPTPGVRSGSPPPYAVLDASVSGGAVQTPSEAVRTGMDAAAPTPPSKAAPDDATVADPSSVGRFFTGTSLIIVLAVLIGLLATFMMPLTAWLVRMRRRRAAVSQRDLIELEWADLTSHLRDLGLAPPPGGTLRQWREHFITQGHLDQEHATAIRRVTATLETARYDRPERTTPEAAVSLHHDIRTLRRQIVRTRAWPARLSSFLWPSNAVAAWRSLLGRLGWRP